MKRGNGFSLIEVTLIVLLIGILAGASFYAYYSYIEKAKSTEAVISVGAIKDAEELHKTETGSYVAAESTDQINEKLKIEIVPKYYEYKVVGVTDDNFIVIAQRIGEDIEKYLTSGKLPPGSIVTAMDKSGIIDSGYGKYLGSGSGGGLDTTGRVEIIGIGDIGTFGGYTGTGTTTGTGTDTGTGITVTGGGTGGGIPVLGGAAPVVYDSDILKSLNMLKDNSTTLSLGDTISYYYDLIIEQNINVVYDDFSKYDAEGAVGLWKGASYNTIYINEDYKTKSPESAIAAVICHEATHADIDYNPEKWITRILERYPQLTRDDVVESGSVLYVYNPDTGTYESKAVVEYSLTEEYICFSNQVETWLALKGGNSDYNNDAWAAEYVQGEAHMRDVLTRAYAGLGDYFD